MDVPTVAMALEHGTYLVIVDVNVVVSYIVEVVVPVADISPSQWDLTDQSLTRYIRGRSNRRGVRTMCRKWASSKSSAGWPNAAAGRPVVIIVGMVVLPSS